MNECIDDYHSTNDLGKECLVYDASHDSKLKEPTLDKLIEKLSTANKYEQIDVVDIYDIGVFFI